eukprot:524749_1
MFTSTINEIAEENGWIPHCHTSPAVYSIIFYFCLVAFAIFNMILSIYNIHKLRGEKSKFITIKILFFLINIFFGFGGIAYTIHLTFGFMCISSQPNAWDSMGLTGLNFYFYGLALLYLLYLLRLWMVCNGTTLLTLSPIIIIICAIPFILQISTTPLITYYFIMLEWEQAIMFMSIFTFLNAIFSLYLLGIFWSKLFKLGQAVPTQQTIDIMTVLSPAIRYACCAFTSIISSQIVNFVSIYRAYINDNEFWWSIHLTLIVMDESINLICLFWQFSFGKKYYFKCLSCFHSLIERRIIKKMSLSVIKYASVNNHNFNAKCTDKVNTFSVVTSTGSMETCTTDDFTTYTSNGKTCTQ